jgi:hypothetical protein
MHFLILLYDPNLTYHENGQGVLMEIIEGIYRIDEASNNMAHSNVYLAINRKELLVVDTGTSGNANKILSTFMKSVINPQRSQRLF